MFLSEWREFPSAPCLTGGGNLMTARVSMLLKSRASLTCFRASFLPGRAKDLLVPRYTAILRPGTAWLLPFRSPQKSQLNKHTGCYWIFLRTITACERDGGFEGGMFPLGSLHESHKQEPCGIRSVPVC